MSHGGLDRKYNVYVPEGYSNSDPIPLVLLLHGGFGSGTQLEDRSSRMDPIAEEEGFVTVYPWGYAATWNAGKCCGLSVFNDVDDVGFLLEVIARLSEQLCIDTARIFVTGMSNGGMMAHRLGCEAASTFAAVAPVAGSLMVDSCEPSRPVSVLFIMGTDDAHQLWDGGVGCGPSKVPTLSVPDIIATWENANDCSGEDEEYLEMGDGTCTKKGECEDDAEVVLCAIEGGGHSWPGGKPEVPCEVLASLFNLNCSLCESMGEGFQSQSFLADQVIWDFFKSHPMAEDPNSHSSSSTLVSFLSYLGLW